MLKSAGFKVTGYEPRFSFTENQWQNILTKVQKLSKIGLTSEIPKKLLHKFWPPIGKSHFLEGALDTKTVDIIFWDILILKGNQSRIISNKHGIYELPHELPKDLRPRILGN